MMVVRSMQLRTREVCVATSTPNIVLCATGSLSEDRHRMLFENTAVAVIIAVMHEEAVSDAT